MPEHPWVDVTWDVIEPGDRVLSPDGTEFHVTARIDMPGDGELSFLLSPREPSETPDAERFWTDRPRGESVRAWRFNDSPKVPGAEAFAVGRLRLAGFTVEELS